MPPDLAISPNRIPWPPLLYALAVGAATVLHTAMPFAIGGGFPRALLGLVLIIGGVGLDVAAMLAMMRAKTNILPHKGADSLVTTGAFALSRNPIYVGNTALLTGLGLVWPNGWLLIGALLAAIAVDRLAIRREEVHLDARFGAVWRAYAARAPRWLGLPNASPGAKP